MRRPFAHALVLLWVAALALTAQAQPDSRWSARLAEGFQHVSAGRLQDATAIFDEVAAAARASADGSLLAEARRGHGRVLAARGDAAGMTAAYDEALVLFETAGNLRGVGSVRSDLGFAAWQRGDYDRARAQYSLAVAVFERAGLRSEQANALRNMTFGDMPPSEKLQTLERALVLSREGTDRRLEGLILHASGDLLSGQSDHQGALERYEAALPLMEGSKDAALARLLTSFGRLHRIHGDPERAVSYYQRTLALLEPTKDHDGLRQAEDAMAVALSSLDRPREALVHAERALKIAEESRPILAAAQRLRVGEVAVQAGDTGRALDLFSSEQVGPTAMVRRLLGRAAALTVQRDFGAALVDANAAVAGARPLSWEFQSRAYWIRSVVHEQAGRLAEATNDAVLAAGVLEAARGGLVVSDDFRAAFSDGYRSFFDRAVELLARSGRQRQAFDVAESARARALLDLRMARHTGTPLPAPVERADELAPDRVRPDRLGTDDTLVAYWVTREATYTWVINAGGVVHSARVSIARKELETLVAKANSEELVPRPAATVARRGQAHTVFESDPRPTLRLLHDRLLGPLRHAFPKKRGTRLIIVPDGPLLGLSFAELLAGNGRYAVEDYTLQYAPSVALLRQTARRASATGRETSTLLVSLSAGYPRMIGETLAPLPGARREVDALVRLFPRATTTRVSEGDATEEHIRAAMGSQTVIHLATHAVASSRHPAESFLALRAGGGHDGRLTAGEIIGMSLRADLVVLSACHGASGQVAGEGMLGLSRALLAAGAHSLLASVRALPDEAAVDILPRFYTAWRTTGDAAVALRSAQLEQLRRLRAGRVRVDTPFGLVTLSEHPSMWAGFVLIGER